MFLNMNVKSKNKESLVKFLKFLKIIFKNFIVLKSNYKLIKKKKI